VNFGGGGRNKTQNNNHQDVGACLFNERWFIKGEWSCLYLNDMDMDAFHGDFVRKIDDFWLS